MKPCILTTMFSILIHVFCVDTMGLFRGMRDKPPSDYLLKIKSFSLFSDQGVEKIDSDKFEAGGHQWYAHLHTFALKFRDGFSVGVPPPAEFCIYDIPFIIVKMLVIVPVISDLKLTRKNNYHFACFCASIFPISCLN